jgi:urease accessory protein
MPAVISDSGHGSDEPLLLVERRPSDQAAAGLSLALTAQERTRLRGRHRTVCGRDVLLQLPRGAALEPGELLSPAGREGPSVRVEAAAEPLLQVSSADPLALLQAAYHLGNRHVAMELHADRLLLLDDSVLADLLRRRGLQVERLEQPFCPEPGAYEGHGHAHRHTHDH